MKSSEIYVIHYSSQIHNVRQTKEALKYICTQNTYTHTPSKYYRDFNADCRFGSVCLPPKQSIHWWAHTHSPTYTYSTFMHVANIHTHTNTHSVQRCFLLCKLCRAGGLHLGGLKLMTSCPLGHHYTPHLAVIQLGSYWEKPIMFDVKWICPV